MTLANEVGELLEDLGLVRRRVLLTAESAELEKGVIAVKPEHPKGDHLMKRRRRKPVDGGIPNQLRIGNGFDVEHQKRTRHAPKVPQKPSRFTRFIELKSRLRSGLFT